MGVTVVTVFVIEPFMGTTFNIYSGKNQHFRALSTCTCYFVTLLTFGINITYKFAPTKTVMYIVSLAVVYFVALIDTLCRVCKERMMLKDPNFELNSTTVSSLCKAQGPQH